MPLPHLVTGVWLYRPPMVRECDASFEMRQVMSAISATANLVVMAGSFNDAELWENVLVAHRDKAAINVIEPKGFISPAAVIRVRPGRRAEVVGIATTGIEKFERATKARSRIRAGSSCNARSCP